MKVLATYSIKGGVGKTTAAVNLGHEAALAGARVLVWDLDPQGAATFFFRVKPKVKAGPSDSSEKGTTSPPMYEPLTRPASTCCPPTSRFATSTCTSTPPSGQPSG